MGIKKDGKIKFSRNLTLIKVKNNDTKDFELIASVRNGVIELLDPKGSKISNWTVPYGAKVFVKEGSKVKKGEKLFSWDPYEKNMNALLKPPDINNLFGTDRMGRDQLSRVIIAIPVAFYLPILTVFISLVIGSLIGVLAGYYGSYCERVLMWFNDILLAIPALLLAIFIVGVFGNGIIRRKGKRRFECFFRVTIVSQFT